MISNKHRCRASDNETNLSLKSLLDLWIDSMKFTNHYLSMIASLLPVGYVEKKLLDYYLSETKLGVQLIAFDNDYFREVNMWLRSFS